MVKRVVLLAVLALGIGAFIALDLGRYLSLEALQAQRAALIAWRDAQPVVASLAFFAIYVAATALSLPGAVILTLAGGAVFGLVWGVLLVSFASTLGATGAFLVARYLARDLVRQRFGERLSAIDQGIEREGAFYLFTLRLVPLFPFFLINLLLGLTRMRASTFFWVSQLGMLPGTLVYVNAGTQLGQLESLAGILSPGLIGAFVLLGIFPLLARRLIETLKARRVYAGWRRPKRFDRNLIVIGAGAAGLVTSYIAAAVKAKVTLIEKHRMGGDCLNTGCVPSKALIRAARVAQELKRAPELGFSEVAGRPDFPRIMARVHTVIRAIEPHDSVERYTALGVECLQGTARFLDPWTVEVDGQRLSAPNIVLATGAEPVVPALPGLAEAGYRTSETLWDLTTLPKRLVVLGGGPIGCELAQAFARLGSRVTLVEQGPRLLPREDAEVSELIEARLRAEGLDLRLAARALRAECTKDERHLVVQEGPNEAALPYDELLVAVGRRPRLQGLGLETLGLPTDRPLELTASLQTRFPHLYACGDVAGRWQFTHTAAHTAWYAAVNALFGPLLALRGGRFTVDERAIPWAIFTDPEVARVGFSEAEAQARGLAYEVTRYALDDLDRAIADGETEGFVKVLTVPGKDRLLGATIVGAHAAELIAEFVLALRHGLGLNQILGTIHAYPTWMEANKYVAGRWKQAHAPERLLRWVARYHRWRRG